MTRPAPIIRGAILRTVSVAAAARQGDAVSEDCILAMARGPEIFVALRCAYKELCRLRDGGADVAQWVIDEALDKL